MPAKTNKQTRVEGLRDKKGKGYGVKNTATHLRGHQRQLVDEHFHVRARRVALPRLGLAAHGVRLGVTHPAIPTISDRPPHVSGAPGAAGGGR